MSMARIMGLEGDFKELFDARVDNAIFAWCGHRIALPFDKAYRQVRTPFHSWKWNFDCGIDHDLIACAGKTKARVDVNHPPTQRYIKATDHAIAVQAPVVHLLLFAIILLVCT